MNKTTLTTILATLILTGTAAASGLFGIDSAKAAPSHGETRNDFVRRDDQEHQRREALGGRPQ